MGETYVGPYIGPRLALRGGVELAPGQPAKPAFNADIGVAGLTVLNDHFALQLSPMFTVDAAAHRRTLLGGALEAALAPVVNDASPFIVRGSVGGNAQGLRVGGGLDIPLPIIDGRQSIIPFNIALSSNYAYTGGAHQITFGLSGELDVYTIYSLTKNALKDFGL